MTACVNKKKSGVVSKVVTASLVGALTLGGVSLAAVPTVAVAEEGASAQMATGTEFTSGSLTLDAVNLTADGNDGGAALVTPGTTTKAPYVTATGNYIQVRVAFVDVPGVGKVNVKDNYSDYSVQIFNADKDGKATGNPLSGDKVLEVGQYVVRVTAVDGDYKGQVFEGRFDVAPATWNLSVTINGSDTTTYTGASQKVTVKDGNDTLTEGVDYEISYSDAKNHTAVDSVKDVLDEGYDVTVKGLGKYATNTGSASLWVKPFELNGTTKFTVPAFDDASQLPQHPDYVESNGVALVDPSVLNVIQANGTVDKPGAVFFQLVVPDSQARNFEWNNGGNDIILWSYKVDHLVDFKYGTKTLGDMELDSDAGERFDANAISAFVNNWSNKDDVDVKVAGGTLADLEAGKVGEYKVTVTLPSNTYKPDGTQVPGSTEPDVEWLGGSKTITVRVYHGTVNADKSLFAYFRGSKKATNDVTVFYDGRPITAGSFTLAGTKDEAGHDVDMSKISAKLLDANGNKVDSAVNAGEYTLELSSSYYKLSGDKTVKLHIKKVDLTTLQVGKLQYWNETATGTAGKYLPQGWYWVGSSSDAIKELNLVFQTGIEPASKEADDATQDASYWAWGINWGGSFEAQDVRGLDWLPFNTDVKVEYNDNGTWKYVTDLTKTGDYRVTVSVADREASNYVLPNGQTSVTLEFTNSKPKTFNDVQPSDWYYQFVEKANSLGFMNGDMNPDGTPAGTFRPQSQLTRQEAVQILFNMSGGEVNETDQSFDKNTGWKTGFTDVDGSDWAAKAIYWAKQTGVVKGDEGTTNFRPADNVNRAEFAQMLYNYAKVVARDTTTDSVDVSKLAFSDNDGIADWAKVAVAWATSVQDSEGNHVISGYPQDNTFRASNNINRGEVAKMIVVYQPNGKLTK